MIKTKPRPKRARGKSRAQGYAGPKQTVRDPRSGVEVALYGDDKGTPELLRQICRQLREFCPDGVLPFPLKGVATAIDGRIGSANMRKDVIDILFENGTFGPCEKDAARVIYATAQLLQAAFDLAHDYRVGSIGAERMGNGRIDAEAIADRHIKARRKYTAMMAVVGGENTTAGVTLLWIICRRHNLSWLERNYGRNRQYWAGVLQASLETIGHSRAH